MIYERLKALYKAGKIKKLSVYIDKKLITQQQAQEIMQS